MKYNSSLANRIDSNYKKMWIWSIVAFFAGLIVLFFIYLTVGLSFIVGGGAAAIPPKADLAIYILFVLSIFLLLVSFLATFVYAVKFVYNAWRTVARPDDKVTPGWRVFLMFVPLFSAIWAFFFFWEFARRANVQLASLNCKPSVSSLAALLYCVLNLLPMFFSVFQDRMNAQYLAATLADSPVALLLTAFILGVLNIVSWCLLLLWIVQAHSASIKIAETRYRISALETADVHTA